MGGDHLPQPDESPHDQNVHLDRPITSQNTGEHGYALLGENVWEVTASSSTFI